MVRRIIVKLIFAIALCLPLVGCQHVNRFECAGAEKYVALTIDDGPSENDTNVILSLLAEYDAKATFFVPGERLVDAEQIPPGCTGLTQAQWHDAYLRNAHLKFSSVIEDMLEQGHELGNHSFFADEKTLLLNNREISSRATCSDWLLRNFTRDPVEIHYFRPAGGLYRPRLSRTIAELNLTITLGDAWPFDTVIKNEDVLSALTKTQISKGSIIILHDGSKGDHKRGAQTVAVLRTLLPWLERERYRVVSLSELSAIKACKLPNKPKYVNHK